MQPGGSTQASLACGADGQVLVTVTVSTPPLSQQQLHECSVENCGQPLPSGLPGPATAAPPAAFFIRAASSRLQHCGQHTSEGCATKRHPRTCHEGLFFF